MDVIGWKSQVLFQSMNVETRKMERLSILPDRLAVPAIVIIGGMAYVAEEFNMPYLVSLALGIFGAFVIL